MRQATWTENDSASTNCGHGPLPLQRAMPVNVRVRDDAAGGRKFQTQTACWRSSYPDGWRRPAALPALWKDQRVVAGSRTCTNWPGCTLPVWRPSTPRTSCGMPASESVPLPPGHPPDPAPLFMIPGVLLVVGVGVAVPADAWGACVFGWTPLVAPDAALLRPQPARVSMSNTNATFARAAYVRARRRERGADRTDCCVMMPPPEPDARHKCLWRIALSSGDDHRPL